MDSQKDKNSPTKKLVTRANTAQTAILVAAFEKQTSTTTERLESLSKETGLYVCAEILINRDFLGIPTLCRRSSP
ncbi:hypothetical protein FA15DRAFT_666284 [Coprinopsis marcescibilis]|uniref:Uncharacterized protein n=1 Tax=Coprinopsis marcescibilis TaxID=230819 RepID=A0A5C3L4T3_COPMA|nr:hypothetical protein FA15DRAFT_666284 [Coprinopsis marcescibilis]